jgi:hypothetical protein
MSDNPVDKKIAEAWKAHRQGFQDKAIEEFRAILHQNPENFDALYGLGLAEKAAGHTDRAVEAFTHLQTKLAGLGHEEDLSGRPGHFYMLTNMVRQQLKTLSS